jgi:protein-disulfide isomerase
MFSSRLKLGLCAAMLMILGAPDLFAQARPPRISARAAIAATIDPGNVSFPSLGARGAPVFIIEFSEFDCAYCRQHAASVLPHLLQKYVDTGVVRYLFVQVPPEEQRTSEKAAIALLCASRSGVVLPVYQELFRAAPLDLSRIDDAATSAGVASEEFTSCMNEPEVRDELKRHAELAKRIGVFGTPTFMIGRAGPYPLMHVVTVFGIQETSYFDTTVQRLLQEKR